MTYETVEETMKRHEELSMFEWEGIKNQIAYIARRMAEGTYVSPFDHPPLDTESTQDSVE